MEKTMACPPSSDSIENKAECEDTVIYIPPDLPPAEWPECCIYWVPEKLRKVNEEAYIPKLVSIGPFHYCRKELRDIEMHKLRYFMDFWIRTSKRQKDLVKIIEDDEEKIRHCYSEDCGLNSYDFVKMILMDAIFIIELFLKTNQKEEKDYILSKPWIRDGILNDLILLENQLPFFVLEKLYMFAFGDSSSCNNREEGQQSQKHKKDNPFIKLSRKYFGFYDEEPYFNIHEAGEVKHFTDLFRYLFFRSSMRFLESDREVLGSRYCATKLGYAGLKFQGVIGRCLLDIRLHRKPCFPFCQSIMEVPTIRIDQSTEALFRNLMTLEQLHYPFQACINNYVKLMNSLINTEKDVDLLVDKCVIVNHIGRNDDVVVLFNKLNLQSWEGPSCYNDLDHELMRHYEHPLNHMVASIQAMYFGDFGRGIATVAALLTLLSLLIPFLTK